MNLHALRSSFRDQTSMPPENRSVHSTSNDDHTFNRCFIGPMPVKMFTAEEVQSIVQMEDHPENVRSGSLFKAMDARAFYFFLRQGGKPEDWDEATREDVRSKMINRWRESEWIRTLRRHHEHLAVGLTSGKRWIGNSFDIGDVLGVNVLNKHASSSLAQTSLLATDIGQSTAPTSSSVDPRSLATAPSPSLSPPVGDSPSSSIPHEVLNHTNMNDMYSSSSALLPGPPADSSADEHHAGPPRSILRNRHDSSASAGLENTGPIARSAPLNRGPRHGFSKRNKLAPRAVRYADVADQTVGGIPQADTPVSPNAVLSRRGSQVNDSSAGAALGTNFAQDFRWGDVVLRDRMLVRVSYTKTEWLPVNFDETQNRRTSNLRYEDWAEFMVVWRKDRLELYEDYTIPGKELLTGHKNLAFLIPLKSERTSVSLYSFADLTFCVLCPPTPVQDGQMRARTLLHRSKEGTNVFVFKVKSRTRAQDWMWHLWRHAGGEIPPFIEIRCPDIETRVKIDVPDTVNVERTFEMFGRMNVINLVRKALGSAHGSSEATSRDWKHVVEREIVAGKTLALAWRLGTQLDWIWQEEDVQGSARRWAVLSGLAFRQGVKMPHLEIRLAEHFPSTIHLPSGDELREPPGIEGYLDRIKPQGQARQRVYVVSHDGNLFALSPWDANPPAPPTSHFSRMVLDEQRDAAQYERDLFESEVKRGTAQIRAAYGVLDLKNIRSVKRLHHMHSDEQRDANEEDEGGHEGLARVHDKAQMRLRRSFEIVLTSGSVLRFEAHSCRDCLEWIDKLLALVTYWSQRTRVDAKEEMNLANTTSLKLLLTSQRSKQAHSYAEPPVDPGSLSALHSLYHWCSLNNCRNILRAGRVFTRKGLRGQYKLVQLFLVSGYLVQYHVSPRSSLHHRRRRDINLMDAYVCSGYLAALALRRSEYDPYAPNAPRRYHDGLQADEPEEDVLFIISYRDSQPSNARGQGSSSSAGPIPSLSAKHKTVVFRTRSRVERDAWCWALGCEIDKIVRLHKDREQKLRETGGLVNLSR
ncbi:Pleckstrin homology domain-containing protein [Phlebopus sp. FC_14]|nr:Pleckstrin homology domain-containing protein [Phlebopus sp. FC_14]